MPQLQCFHIALRLLRKLPLNEYSPMKIEHREHGSLHTI